MTHQQLLKAKRDTNEEGLQTITERLLEINKPFTEMPPKVKAQLSLDPNALKKPPWTPLARSCHT